MSIIKLKDLKKVRAKHIKNKIVLVTGTFDLFHAGHVLFFEDCKKLGDILVVGLGGDKAIKLSKGEGRPILNQHLRIKMLDSIKPVDYCFLDTVSDQKPYLYILEVVFPKLKPDFYIVNDDATKMKIRKKICDKHGIKIIIKKRNCPPEFEKISTSQIIDKIKRL